MSDRTGLLFVGALGYVATCVMMGVLSLRQAEGSSLGLVTELDELSGVALPDPAGFEMGGWDIRSGSPLDTSRSLLASMSLPSVGAESLSDLAYIPIFPGCINNCGKTVAALADNTFIRECETLRDAIDSIREDICSFRRSNDLDTVVVVNLASTEPLFPLSATHLHVSSFEKCLAENRKGEVRASMLYSWAAVSECCPYINFTPSQAALTPALIELAETRSVPVMGNDGKTGETLVKSVLAPLFRYRNLEVMSWESFNILGNMDGRVLDDPENRESKLATKEGVLPKILGYEPHSRVHINHVPSLDDQKTAWNFIHFRGFMGARMSLQFVWQGHDSFLAAPLVIDLVRLVAHAAQHGQGGLQRHLASFFKSPVGVDEHRFSEQFGMLKGYLKGGAHS